jgi:hypothetical protein
MQQNSGYHIIRADRSGVFIGKIVEKEGSILTVTNARRLYYWSGALDVVTIAAHGVSKPSNCKFSAQLGDADKSTILNVIEYHPIAESALQTINSVAPWKS